MLKDRPWIRWIVLLQKYAANPSPDKYTLKQLGFIWLYSTCLYDQWDADPILSDPDWDQLSLFLKSVHHLLDAPMRWAIPYSCLDTGTGLNVSWIGQDLGTNVMNGCEAFLKSKEI